MVPRSNGGGRGEGVEEGRGWKRGGGGRGEGVEEGRGWKRGGGEIFVFG